MRAVEDLRASGAAHGGGLLVLDEPTPFLPRVGVDQLFALVRQVVADGASVIFVSHDVAEVMEITDRATVLRDGVLVGTLQTRSATHADFVERIVGRAVTPFHVHALSAARRRPAARLDALVAPGLGPVSLEIGEGEIIGHDRPDRLGLRPVCPALYGAAPRRGRKARLRDRRGTRPRAWRSRTLAGDGRAYLPADRLGAAGVGALSGRRQR